MSGRLAGKTVLVTGATGRLGRAIAVRMAAEGARVVVSGRDAERGHGVVAEIRAMGGKAEFVPGGLDGSQAASTALAREAERVIGGRIHVLVNNAGIFPAAATLDTDEATLDEVLAVNVKAPFFLTAALVPSMIEAGDGAIVNIGSWVVRLGLAGGTAYAASKGALETLTRSWAAEFGPRGVRVNAIAPGVIVDGAAQPSPAAFLMNATPAGREGLPHDIAYAAVYLASAEAAFVHGSVLDIDGGRVTTAVISS